MLWQTANDCGDSDCAYLKNECIAASLWFRVDNPQPRSDMSQSSHTLMSLGDKSVIFSFSTFIANTSRQYVRKIRNVSQYDRIVFSLTFLCVGKYSDKNAVSSSEKLVGFISHLQWRHDMTAIILHRFNNVRKQFSCQLNILLRCRQIFMP